jgi:FAD/FMN-containing dehydrogenase
MGEAVEGFELLPRAALDIVLRYIPGTRAPLDRGCDWNVLIEATAPLGAPDPQPALEQALGDALESGLIEDAMIAASEAQAEALWRIRDSMAEAESKDRQSTKHDISVAVDAMPGFMVEAAAAVERRFVGTSVMAFGHLGDGNVHFNVRAPDGAASDWLLREGPATSAYVHDLVTAAGGSLSAEHGIGQARLAELERIGDPTRLRAMAAIKRALDPRGIMNPGKLVPLAEGEGGP